MKWSTRSDCQVDRAACAWLIRRFIDAEAQFVFVDDPDDVPAGSIAFDIRGAELSHRNGNCSFETFLVHYGLDDPALRALGRVVHEADLGDDRYDAPEAPGLEGIVRGLAATRTDLGLFEATTPIFDALYTVNGGLLRRAQAPTAS